MFPVESAVDDLALALERPIVASIERLLAIQAERQPDAAALMFSGGPPITYRNLHEQVVAIGASLRSAGVASHDRVAIVHPNGPGMAVAFLGVASAATCAPLNPTYAATEFDFYLEDLDARAVIVPSNWDSPVREVAAKRGISVIELTDRASPEGRVFALDVSTKASTFSEPEPSDDGIALILHTSGTTARPKMIRLTQRNLCASAVNIRSTLRLTESDRCLNVMPLFHIHGLIGALLSSMASGACVICTPGFSPVHFYDWLDEFQPTWYSAVPSMHQEILARAAASQAIIARSRLRFIRSSSAALSPLVMGQLESTFDAPVIQAMGMTEASHQIASNPLPPETRKPGSVGLPTGVEVAILDDRDNSLPSGVAGEISIRGPNVTTVRPSAGKDLIPRAADEWFRTGDVGFLDEDGYLFISGRIKEIINRGGEKIAPIEIDEVLLEHPGVAQAIACGVADARLGEDVIAVVVRRAGSTLTERELREFASTRIAAFKVPRRIMFVDQIPKGPTGKIQRIGLAKKLGIESLSFAQPGGSVQFAAPQTPTELTLAEIWGAVLGIDRIGVHDNFFELGGDSMAAADVIARCESRLGVTINIRDMGFGTLQQVAAGCNQLSAVASTQARAGTKSGGWMRRIVSRVRRES
jgi:acyl-CoA synthetase (AMP-forming)/AMP-acid ligase II/acyl carrier protein